MIRLEEKIIYEADFILHGKRTMPEVADALKINIRTLQIHINEKLKDIDLRRYQMVREHLAKITTERQKVGGTIGKKTTSYNMDLVNLMADDMISSYEVMSDSNMQVKTLKDLEAFHMIILHQRAYKCTLNLHIFLPLLYPVKLIPLYIHHL